VPGDENPTDLLTKSITGARLLELRELVGMIMSEREMAMMKHRK